MVEYLSAAVSQLVYDLCEGVGDRPELPLQVNCGAKRKLPEEDKWKLWVMWKSHGTDDYFCGRNQIEDWVFIEIHKS